uniref:Protein FAM50 homolog n=2 Tax=Meloidogyne TaxID=189290 RepID=A0A915LV98_MELJA
MSQADSGRIIHLEKRRERAKEDIEKQRLKLEEEKKSFAAGISSKFTTNVDQIEEKFKASTVGLVTLDEVKERQNEIYSLNKELSKVTDDNEQKPRFDRVVQKRVLSFKNFDDEEEDEKPVVIVKKRLGMDPTVDTSFLPDRERDEQIQRERERIGAEWLEMQEKEKNEEIMVAFCYWDGSSHRRDFKTKKGTTIAQFLQKALDLFRKEFLELKLATVENLMFIKEDLIIPHFYTFQDFIKTRQMGKTGPLWQFESVGEIRVRQDAALDVGESHPVKANFEDTRCRCTCPSTEYFAPKGTNHSQHYRRYYTKTNLESSNCNAQTVVKKDVQSIVEGTRLDAFLANCNCRFESRNSLLLKVVVMFVIAVIFILGSYMLYLGVVEPMVFRQRQPNSTAFIPYSRHTDVDREDVGDLNTFWFLQDSDEASVVASDVMDDQSIIDDHIFSSTTTGIPSSNEFSAISLEDRQQTRSRHSTNATTVNSTVKASLHDKVIEKVTAEQNKWKVDVEEQRRNVLGEHSVLN